jgi:hypothetical protein
MNDSPFTDEWRDCLREHYKETARADEKQTLKTLSAIMNRVGFREVELQDLYVQATMRADDMPDDFVPDIVGIPTPDAAALEQLENRHPLECQCPSCVDKNLIPHTTEGQPLTGDALAEALDRAAWHAQEDDDHEIPSEDPDSPQQLSLF